MALENQMDVEAFAQSLTECADSIHDRLMKAIKNGDIDKGKAQIIFQDEIILRQRANGLYIDAANCLVEGLADSQSSILDSINSAKAQIKDIEEIAGFIDLIADLIVLAAAACAAKPAPIVAALKEVREDVDALNASN